MKEKVLFSKRYKVSFEFTQEEVSLVNSLIKPTFATSKLEVVKRAIRLYNLIVQENKKGNKLYLQNEGGIIKEILIF